MTKVYRRISRKALPLQKCNIPDVMKRLEDESCILCRMICSYSNLDKKNNYSMIIINYANFALKQYS